MKSRTLFLLAPVLLLASAPAYAHFKLMAPADWIVTTAQGDPQKMNPCGTTGGMPTNMVTKVRPGSKLKVQWMETVGHPGHYRIAIAADRAQLTEPATVVQANDCKSAAIQATPVAPVIADGLFVHAAGAMGMMYEQEITVPNMICDKCTLQVLEFMSSHAPPCYYHHCANLQITNDIGDAGTGTAGDARDAAAGGGGGARDAGAGVGGSGGSLGVGGAGGAIGSGGTPGGGSAGSTGGGSTGSAGSRGGNAGSPGAAGGSAGTTGEAGMSGTVPMAKDEAGCGCRLGAHTSSSQPTALAALVLAAMLLRRRRPR